MKLSGREKKLIGILVILLLVVSLSKLYDWVSDRYTTAAQNVESLQSEADFIDATINSQQNRKAQLEQLLADTETLQAQYYPLLSNSEADELVTGMLLNNKLTPYTLSVSDMVNTGVSAYQQNADNATLTNNGGVIYITQIQVTCAGSYQAFLALLDEVAANPAIHIYHGELLRSEEKDSQQITLGIWVVMMVKEG